MMRIVSIWLPQWPIERLKRERQESASFCALEGEPFALVETGERGLTLSAVNAAAHAQGLHPGLGFADARARCPQLRSAAADATADARALIALARWCGRYSPSLNTDGSDGLWIDITGVAHLFGGEDGLIADLKARLARLGLTARIAIADTLGAASALARCARKPIIVPAGRHKTALAPLPVEALRLASDTTLLLRRLGLKCIGQLYDVPRATLARRFASREAAQAVLLRLDQALGAREEPLEPLSPPLSYLARLAFPEPLICAQGVDAALAKLAQDLCGQLALRLSGARTLTFTAYRSDGSVAMQRVGLSAPCRTPAHLLSVLADKVAGLDLGFGADALTLAANAVERLSGTQTAFARRARQERPDLLIDRLANRLGTTRVLRPVAVASHRPERAQAWRPALAAAPAAQAEPIARAARPPLLLDRPEPIAVLAEIPDGPPARFTWRRVSRRVLRAQGPERIAPEWWREMGVEHPRPRDYYQVEDEAGGRYWVFREGLYGASEDPAPPAWYLHGMMG